MEESQEKQRWKVTMKQQSISKSGVNLENIPSKFQGLGKHKKGTLSRVKEGSSETPQSGLLSIPEMFPQTNDYFAEAAKFVGISSNLSTPNSIYTCIPGTPGELEGCLLSGKDKQLIHKLVTQAMYKSMYKRGDANEPTNGIAKSVS